MPQEVELSALLDTAREQWGAVTAEDVAFKAAVAERAWLRAQEPQGLPRLGEEVEALILGHPHAGLVPVAKLVVLPDLDVIRRAISVPQTGWTKAMVTVPRVTQHFITFWLIMDCTCSNNVSLNF